MSFDLARLRALIKPFRLHWFPRLGSTNDHAAVMRRRGDLYAPAIVLTGHQLAGRGRGTNQWWSGRGCITATFVLPVDEQRLPHQIPLIAGLAVRNAAAELTGNEAIQLKWPNDLWFEGRKLAGLLCERIDKADLIGLGLNVNTSTNDIPTTLRDTVTSLSVPWASRPRLSLENRGRDARGTGEHLDLTNTLAAVASHLYRLWSRGAGHPFGAVLQEYDTYHALIGRVVRVSDGGELPVTGRVEGLDEMGRLILKSRGKIHHIVCGQVTLV